VPFRVLAAGQNPDHNTISEFRRRHLETLPKIFSQVLQICEKAGLVRLGHVALDGTKMNANASKHKSMSYGHMKKKEKELEKAIAKLFREAEALDRREDQQYGKDNRGDELPEDLRFKLKRLAKIKVAKAELEAEAKVKAEQAEAERGKRKGEDEDSKRGGGGGRPPQTPSGIPKDKAQRNFTDPDSRIMIAGATKSFEQCYNCQTAVDDRVQVIVATYVTQEANDKQQLQPLVEAIKENFNGDRPGIVSADAGYWSEDNGDYLEAEGIDGHIATGRIKRSDKPESAPHGRIPIDATKTQRMARKLKTERGKAIYKMRKAIVEPVFGQIKFARWTRQFLLRSKEKVSAEWNLICAGHNLLKYYLYAWNPKSG
jgi:hypothetical protein